MVRAVVVCLLGARQKRGRPPAVSRTSRASRTSSPPQCIDIVLTCQLNPYHTVDNAFRVGISKVYHMVIIAVSSCLLYILYQYLQKAAQVWIALDPNKIMRQRYFASAAATGSSLHD